MGKMRRLAVFAVLMVALQIAAPVRVHADTTKRANQKKMKTTVNGVLRAFYFTRGYERGQADQAAFSIGGRFHAETNLPGGWGAGVTALSADPFGANNAKPLLVDN